MLENNTTVLEDILTKRALQQFRSEYLQMVERFCDAADVLFRNSDYRNSDYEAPNEIVEIQNQLFKVIDDPSSVSLKYINDTYEIRKSEFVKRFMIRAVDSILSNQESMSAKG